jgi:hypothetical protein
LNNDFNDDNVDSPDEVHPFYDESTDGTNIRFGLAKYDEAGNSTTGITRTYTDIQGFDEDQYNMHQTLKGGKDNWNPAKFLNIWVIAFQEGSQTFGWAYPPTVLTEEPRIDGMVIRHDAFGTVGTAGSVFPEQNLGRTGTHEVGHYFNLAHIWGEGSQDDPACGDDHVSDTPPAIESNGGCPEGPINANSTCGSDDRGEMFMNYMDYVNDACMYMFTEGQTTRMRAALEGPRKGLLTSGGITALTSTDVFNVVTVYPNPSNSGEFSIDLDGQIELIKVSDAYGRVILEKTINKSNYKLDLSAYSNGIYYLEVTSKGLTATQKIIKQ